ncbi:MAG: single-stranded DNA-binding protein [Treponema sp.]|nr:single-stranded DNA-binding protein [Treponema sp.]MEE3434961.1 single-stranded DNA-binding protein [Treponema sp.]
MNNINCLVVEGNITREPNFRTSPSGFPICKIPIAVNHYYKKAASGEYENEVSYFDVETFGKLAEICAKFSQKGRGLSVVGRLKQNRWKTPEGKNTSRVTIIAEKIEFKQRFNKAEAEESEADASAAETESAAEEATAASLAEAASSSDDGGEAVQF